MLEDRLGEMHTFGKGILGYGYGSVMKMFVRGDITQGDRGTVTTCMLVKGAHEVINSVTWGIGQACTVIQNFLP